MIGYFGSVESNVLYVQFQESMNIMDSRYQQNHFTTFTLEAVPKENRQWFWNWRSTHFYHTDSYFIVTMGLIRIQWPYNIYNITWTNFKSRQSFLGYKTCICWDSTVVVYRRTLLTKVIIKQISFFQKIRDKLITY